MTENDTIEQWSVKLEDTGKIMSFTPQQIALFLEFSNEGDSRKTWEAKIDGQWTVFSEEINQKLRNVGECFVVYLENKEWISDVHPHVKHAWYTTREEQINLTTGLTRLVRVADGEEEENMFSETIELTILSFCDGETGLILSNYFGLPLDTFFRQIYSRDFRPNVPAIGAQPRHYVRKGKGFRKRVAKMETCWHNYQFWENKYYVRMRSKRKTVESNVKLHKMDVINEMMDPVLNYVQTYRGDSGIYKCVAVKLKTSFWIKDQASDSMAVIMGGVRTSKTGKHGNAKVTFVLFIPELQNTRYCMYRMNDTFDVYGVCPNIDELRIKDEEYDTRFSNQTSRAIDLEKVVAPIDIPKSDQEPWLYV